MDFIALSGSVFTALRGSVFSEAFGSYCIKWKCLLRARAVARAKLRILSSILEIVVATIPLIDAASNNDSNGGYIVIWSKLDHCFENPAVGPNLDELGGK